jgi:uncharacterized protein YbaA (DUF1428 family)
MFGRHKKNAGGEEARLLVEATLESDIAQVEQSVTDYLADPTAASRHSLLTVLERLTAQTDQSDAYERSVIGSAAVGYASKGEVLGETSIDPVVDEVPSGEFTAQSDLVKAAKEEVRGPTAATFASLQAADAALAEVRNRGASGG